MATALAFAPTISPLSSEVSTTLSVSAGVAYEVFADAVEVPRWLPIVQASRVVKRTPEGRPEKVAFTRKLDRGSLGYTLDYKYDPQNLTVSWATPASSNVVMYGEARFVTLSVRVHDAHHRARPADRRRLHDPQRASTSTRASIRPSSASSRRPAYSSCGATCGRACATRTSATRAQPVNQLEDLAPPYTMGGSVSEATRCGTAPAPGGAEAPDRGPRRPNRSASSEISPPSPAGPTPRSTTGATIRRARCASSRSASIAAWRR